MLNTYIIGKGKGKSSSAAPKLFSVACQHLKSNDAENDSDNTFPISVI